MLDKRPQQPVKSNRLSENYELALSSTSDNLKEKTDSL